MRAMYRRQSQPRYDDVPNATEEEIQQYPRILATFFQQAMRPFKDFTTLCHCVTGWGDFPGVGVRKAVDICRLFMGQEVPEFL